MGCYCESNIISGIPNSNRKEGERDEKFVKRVAIPKLADLERMIPHVGIRLVVIST
jgi:hypothetical protein